MDKFWNQFKDNLENRSEPDFEDRYWKRLEKDLVREQQPKRSGFAWWWAIAGLLLLLLGSNALFFLELKKANEKISALEIKKDTIFKTNVIYSTDTIYSTKTIEKRIIEYVPAKTGRAFANMPNVIPFKLKTSFASNPSENNTTPFNLNHSSLADYWRQQQAKNSPSHTDETQALWKPNDLTALSSITLRPLNFKHSTLPTLNVESYQEEKRKTLRHHLYAMRPKAFRLGLTGGMLYPFDSDQNTETGFTAGIEAAVEFSDNLQMWLNTSFSSYIFDSERMDESIGVPIFNPPSDDFVFVQAEGKQPFLQYSVGMQYFFNEDKKWKPFVGVGLGAISFLSYDVIYDFEDKANEIEWNFDQTVSSNQLITDFLLLRTGLEYRFSDKLFWHIRAGYRANLGRESFKAPKLLNAQTGLMYRF